MSSRNEDRLGLGLPVPSKDSVETPEIVEAKEMGLDFPNPTEFVDLPSRGKLYPEGHPLKDVEELEINFMTTKDEDILSSKQLLKKGKAIEKFIDHIVVDKRVNSKNLLIADKNAILMAARITGYGSDYEAAVICQACGERFKESFDLEEITPMNGGIPEGDKETEQTENGNFLVKLAKTKWVVEVRPLYGKDEEILFKSMEQARRKKKAETTLSDQLRLMINSIRIGEKTYTDDVSLEKAVQRMPAGDGKTLRKKYGELFPSIDTKKSISCPECDVEQEVDMPIDAGFFWSK